MPLSLWELRAQLMLARPLPFTRDVLYLLPPSSSLPALLHFSWNFSLSIPRLSKMCLYGGWRLEECAAWYSYTKESEVRLHRGDIRYNSLFKIQNLHESRLSAKSFSSLSVIIQWLAFKINSFMINYPLVWLIVSIWKALWNCCSHRIGSTVHGPNWTANDGLE